MRRAEPVVVAMLVASALLAAVAASARAHGGSGHGGPGSLGAGSVVVDGYRIEMLGDPAPLAAGIENRIIAKITRVVDGSPVSGGIVLLRLERDGRPAPHAEATAHGATEAHASGAAHAASGAHGPAGARGQADAHEPSLQVAPDSRFPRASEVTWAGHYAVTIAPERAGMYDVRAVVSELESRRFEPPLSFTARVEVHRAPGLGWPAWTALAGAALVGGVGLYGVRLRARDRGGDASDLLAIGWLRRVLTSRAFQPALQIPLLVATSAIVVLGFVDVQDGGKNLATKLTWTIWWAGVIFTFVLAGRAWCLACPFGALNEWTSRASGATRRLPRIFRNLWWATALFILLTWADEQLGVVRSPWVTALLVVAFATAAIAVGLRYERRSFCRYLCPIGGLIGIYSMTAPLALRTKHAPTCRAHAEKVCYQGSATSRGCPMFEFPQSLDRNTYCTFCAECVRGCSHGNLALRFRAFGTDLWAATRRALDESYLVVALVALTLVVTAQMLSAWPEFVSDLARWLPSIVRTSLKPVTYLGLVETVLLLGGSLVAGPLLMLSAASVSNRLAGGAGLSVRRTFVLFGYMFVPVGLAMHLAHNLAHLLLEGGGVWPALQRAVATFTPWSLGQPDWTVTPIAPMPVVALLQMVTLVTFFAMSLVAGHRLSLTLHRDRRVASRALVPFAVLAFAFTVVGIVLLNQPMGMRHGM